MKTLGDFLYWAEKNFISNDLTFGHGTDNAWDDAVAIALFVLKLAPNVGKEVLDRKLQLNEKKLLIELVNKRINENIPVPYLTKEAWFCEEKYYVDHRVIIPRSPFAELIKNKFKPYLQNKNITSILDLCTGSGCIAIAAAKQFPNAVVDAIDISDEALEVANYNIKQHKLENRVSTIKSDLFKNIKNKKYDIIISNPPYVGIKEHDLLPDEYHHEPELALVSGVDGFDCAKEILRSAGAFLKYDGLLFVEIGVYWRKFVKLYPDIPFEWLSFKNGGEGVFLLRDAPALKKEG